MNKTAIKNFAISARKKLIAMAVDKAGLIGITKENVAQPISQGGDFAVFPTHFGTETRIDKVQLHQRESLIGRIREKGYDSVMEEVAYTWFNRLIAVRFMEVNDYLPSRVRVLSSETLGKAEPDLVTLAPKVELGFTDAEVQEIYALKDDPRKSGELFKLLFIKQCNALGDILPELFEKTTDYTELLFDLSWDKEDSVVRALLTIDEADFLEAVEIIGWMYQYYNTELKQDVFDGLKKNIKITKEHIPAATQLFTPDWIVRYMVENSLGRIYVESGVWSVESEGERAIAEKMGWKYYLPEAEQTPEVRAQLQAQRSTLHTDFHIEDIKIIDPCMGSGHILVYAFEVLMQIYVSKGYSERDAAGLILEKNLYGLDIDKRAYQLSYFALMMKGRRYDRRFFGRDIAPQVYCPVGYPDGEEYGSLLLVDKLEPKPEPPEELTLFNMDYNQQLNAWNFRRLLAQKYDVVVTNPPYMGSSGMSTKLADFVKKNFPDSKSDMFACFIEKGNQMAKPSGYNCMVTMQSWMFLSSFEKMREKLIATKTIFNLMHMENMVMGIAFGTAVTNFRNTLFKGYKGTYNQITMKDIGESGEPVAFPVRENRFAQVSAENFSKIPGSPIAYWVSEAILRAYNDGKLLGNIAFPKTGMTTGDNNRFLRLWNEVDYNKICLMASSADEALDSKSKWFPYCKGGGFKRWYGYNEYMVNWRDNGYEIKNNVKENGLKAASVRSENLYFRPLITWSAVTSGLFSCRYSFGGALFDSGGSSISVSKHAYYLLSLLNSNVGQYILNISNSTINYQPGDIAGVPVIFSEIDRVEELAESNIATSKLDWDSYETSWDFKRHPLV